MDVLRHHVHDASRHDDDLANGLVSELLEGFVVERASQSHVIIKLLDGEQACNDAPEGAARFVRASTTRVNVFVVASGEEYAYVHMHRVTSRDCV